MFTVGGRKTNDGLYSNVFISTRCPVFIEARKGSEHTGQEGLNRRE